MGQKPRLLPIFAHSFQILRGGCSAIRLRYNQRKLAAYDDGRQDYDTDDPVDAAATTTPYDCTQTYEGDGFLSAAVPFRLYNSEPPYDYEIYDRG